VIRGGKVGGVLPALPVDAARSVVIDHPVTNLRDYFQSLKYYHPCPDHGGLEQWLSLRLKIQMPLGCFCENVAYFATHNYDDE
jgi:hypothetical protein